MQLVLIPGTLTRSPNFSGYMAACGIPAEVSDHARRICELALDMRYAVSQFTNPLTGKPLQCRIGINSGPLMAAVIGKKKLTYDVFGKSCPRSFDSVAIAHSRIVNNLNSTTRAQVTP